MVMTLMVMMLMIMMLMIMMTADVRLALLKLEKAKNRHAHYTNIQAASVDLVTQRLLCTAYILMSRNVFFRA